MQLIGILIPSILLLASVSTFQLSDRFPPNITWVNSLDSELKLKEFLASDHRMARQRVELFGDTLVMGDNLNFTMLSCITIFLRVESTHFIQFHVHNNVIFQAVYQLLKNFNSPRFGVSANIEKGPNCRCPLAIPTEDHVPRNNVYYLLKVWPTKVRLIFGWVTSPGPINQYSKSDLRIMFDTVNVYDKRHGNQDYIFEFDAIFLSNKFNLNRNMDRIIQYKWLVIIYAPNMTYGVDVEALRKMIYYVGPKSVYLNVPDAMREYIGIFQEMDANHAVAKGYGNMHVLLSITLIIIAIKIT